MRSVEVAKQAERNNWDLADAIHEDIGSLDPNLTQVRFGPGVATGLAAAEKQIHEAMANEGVADFTPVYLHNLFVRIRQVG